MDLYLLTRGVSKNAVRKFACLRGSFHACRSWHFLACDGPSIEAAAFSTELMRDILSPNSRIRRTVFEYEQRFLFKCFCIECSYIQINSKIKN